MDIHTAQETLAQALRQSAEYQDYVRQRDAVFQDNVSKALLDEYESLQTKLQMYALTGKQAEQGDIDRFTQLNGLMSLSPQISGYLLSKVRMQKLLADVFAGLSEACELPIKMPQL